MKIVSAAAAAVLSLSVAACAVNRVPVATGGSKADGTVDMSYTYGGFEAPKVDVATATTSAIERCKVWGYTGAQPFGGEKVVCNMMGGMGCAQYTATMTFQCTGGK